MMYSFAILFTVASVAASGHPGQKATPPPSKYMPNIQYFLRGYNVMKANPHQTSVSAVDPGFQEPIFKLSYDKGSITPDDKYFSPDGTLVTICKACSLSAVTKKISGMTSYRNSLSEKVKYSGGEECFGCWQCPYGVCFGCPWWCHFSFSGSVDYKKVETQIHQHSNFYTHSDASCCAYQVQTDLYKPPPFSSDFLRGIISLPENYTPPENKALYRKFIDSFGTNYIKQTDMGSLFGQEIKVSKESWKSMINKSIDIDWSLRWSFFFAWNDIEGKFDNETKRIKEFHKFTSSRELYTKGSKPPKDEKLSTWVDEAKKSPAPIALKLGSMIDLFIHLNVPQPIIKNMNDSLYNYCDHTQCKDLNPDQEFPRKWQDWLTTFDMGVRSDPLFCANGDYVIQIKLAREPIWPWTEGLSNLCFICSTNSSEWNCFNGPTPGGIAVWGNPMQCSTNGFRKMQTYDDPYPSDPINVRSQCYDDSQPQYAFNNVFPGKWGPWVECDADKKIVGFQIETNTDPIYVPKRIINFRFECA